MHIITEINNWMLSFVGTTHAEIALFLIAFMESSFFPLPPDILLIAMALYNPSQAFFYALICSIGSVVGGNFGYSIGKFGGRPVLDKFFSKEKIIVVENYFNKYDVWAVAIAGFTPIPYKIFTIASGVFKANLLRFNIASTLSRSSRFFIVATTLYFWGAQMKDLVIKYINYLSIIFVILFIGGFYFIKVAAKKAKKEHELKLKKEV